MFRIIFWTEYEYEYIHNTKVEQIWIFKYFHLKYSNIIIVEYSNITWNTGIKFCISRIPRSKLCHLSLPSLYSEGSLALGVAFSVCPSVRQSVRMTQIFHLHVFARAYCTPGLVLFNIAILQIIQISSMSPLSSKFVL